jgi:hypothetical protein
METQQSVAVPGAPARRRLPGAGDAPADPPTSDAPETPASWVTTSATRLTTLRLALVTAAYAILSVATTWPLAAHLGNGVFSAVDPVDSIWRIGWGQERLLHAPWKLFEGNTFFPYARSYLFDELLLGQAILTLPLRLLTDNPVAIYNLAVLLTLVLSGLGAYALARHLGCGVAAAFLAGAIYAFAPLHLAHLGHLGVLSGQYFPLIILLLDRLFNAPRPRDALLLALALAMQALSSQYYAFYLLFVVGGFVGLRLVQLGVHRRFPSRATWAALAAAGGLALAAVAPFFLGYRLVQGDYTVERTIAQNAYYSANVASFFTADWRNWLWGGATAPLRAVGTYTFERNMFPGAIALALALVGALVSWRRWLGQYLILLALGSAILSFGPHLYLTADPKSVVFEYLPYRWLYYKLPGLDSMRVPARIGMLYLLSISALAGIGFAWLIGRLAQLRLPRVNARWIALAAAALLILLSAAEGLNRPYTPAHIESGAEVPQVYRWLASQSDAVVAHLPMLIPDHDRELQLNNRFQYFSLYHRHPILNGSANVVPKGYKALFYEFRGGPTPRALTILQGLGVTHLVVSYDELDPRTIEQTRALLDTPGGPATMAADFGNDVVYRLAPTDHFDRLRAIIPPGASIYLSREDPTGAYGGLLGRILGDNPIYTRVRVEFGRAYQGPPDPAMRYDYAILYHQEDPAAVGYADATVVWEDEVVRVYQRK